MCGKCDIDARRPGPPFGDKWPFAVHVMHVLDDPLWQRDGGSIEIIKLYSNQAVGAEVEETEAIVAISTTATISHFSTTD